MARAEKALIDGIEQTSEVRTLQAENGKAVAWTDDGHFPFREGGNAIGR
jgi:hypothetical protein